MKATFGLGEHKSCFVQLMKQSDSVFTGELALDPFTSERICFSYSSSQLEPRIFSPLSSPLGLQAPTYRAQKAALLQEKKINTYSAIGRGHSETHTSQLYNSHP